MMRIRFWGTRGSRPQPGPGTLRFGGNTLCVEVRTADGTLIVLDCGSGAPGLGQALLASGERPLRGHLLFTHTHWDHIQGFPFFAPFILPGNEWDIYGPGGLGHHIKDGLAGQMDYAYFPVQLEQLGARLRFHDLGEGTLGVGEAVATTCFLNHTTPTIGYRLEVGGATFVYATDHEPHMQHVLTEARAREPMGTLAGDRLGMRPNGSGGADGPNGSAGVWPIHREERRHVEFLAGADLVIHDAQYTLAEYQQKLGWGHSPAEYAVDVAVAAGVNRLALFHHEPLREDGGVDQVVEHCRQRAAAAGSALQVFAATEGDLLELPERPTSAGAAPSANGRAAALLSRRTADAPFGESGGDPAILFAGHEPDAISRFIVALQPERFRILTAHDGEAALATARAERPTVIVLDPRLPGRDGLDGLAVCQAIRADAEAARRNVPVLLLTHDPSLDLMEAGFAAGASDHLTLPFTSGRMRTRVRNWLLRSATPSSGIHTADTPAQRELVTA